MDWFLYDNGLRHERVKSMFNLHGDIRNVEEEIIYLQNTLNDYFKVQYGTTKNDNLMLNIRRSTVIFQSVNSKKL